MGGDLKCLRAAAAPGIPWFMPFPPRNRFSDVPQIVALWVSFLAYSLIRAPIPAVNEPHYLVKARHYWQPEWCAGDLFVESANPHLVFYQTIGWLTAVASLETAALLGRGIALLLLAIGWDRLVSQLLAGRWRPLAMAWLFLLLQTSGNFAGEWLVGGVESKVIAYALVMWGCGALLDNRPKTGGALIGGAVSFHPVVGAWCGCVWPEQHCCERSDPDRIPQHRPCPAAARIHSELSCGRSRAAPCAVCPD